MAGYRDAKMNIDINGTIAEMQVHIPEILEMKENGPGHDIYKKMRAIEDAAKIEKRELTPEEAKELAKLQAESEKVYGDAWDALTKRLNSSSETRTPLFTTDEAGKGRGSDLSQAAQNGLPSGSIDTGMPSTSKNLTSLENFITAPENSMGADMFSAKSIVAEKPDLTIPDGNGGLVRARDALAQADENISTAERESVAFNVAAECALVE
jgi:phosphoenolpyruvate synthase/pyruvate phosphate dikinase